MHNSQSEILADLPALRIGYRDTAGSKDTSKAELQLSDLEQAIRNSKGFFALFFTASNTVANAGYFGRPAFVPRCRELRILQPNLSPP
jgi:hypothetical protein